MCGISGIFEFNPQQKFDLYSLKAMNKAIFHRGPDEEGYFDGGNIGLGSRRLSIIDIASGRQPIFNEDKKFVIVFNGEIYNYRVLKQSLQKKGHRFITNSDTEVILHLFEEEGENCVKKLDGMFSLAIWNVKKRELFLARDPLGKKPLFWTIIENKFIFSSEIKGLLSHKDFKKSINEESLAKYFLYGFVPAPSSIFKNIQKLLPGHFLTVDSGGEARIKKYWELDYCAQEEFLDEEELENEIIKYLEKAVQKRLIADVPIGVFLSGGIDSGLVTAMMRNFISPSKIDAFSIGFEEKNYDESSLARLVAKKLEVNHHLKIFSKKDLLSLIPGIVDILDEPMADSSILPTVLLSRFAREKVKVVLSGDGGDENFAGYPKYLAHLLLENYWLKKIPLSLFSSYFSGKTSSFFAYANRELYLRNQFWINPFSLDEVHKLIGLKPSYIDLERYHHAFNGKGADEALFLDQKITLPDLYLVKTDRASMSASLEIRSPFLDKDLTMFAAKIPLKNKLKDFKTKRLLRNIAKKYLPLEVINKPKKGFGVPISLWLKGKEGNEILNTLSREKIKKEGILDCKVVEVIVKSGNSQKIWALLVFEWWQRKWLKN